MTKFLKRLSVLLLTLSIVVGLAGCKTTPDKGDLVDVKVELYNVDMLYEGTFEIDLNSSVYDLLEKHFVATYQTFDFGKMLSTVAYKTHKLAPEGNSFIAFYVNGESSMVGISDYFVKENDVIAFKLESW